MRQKRGARVEDYRAGLIREIEEADLETGRAAQDHIQAFQRRLEHHAHRYATSRNPILRRYHRWRLERYRGLVLEAREHIEKARAIRTQRAFGGRR